MASGDGSDWGSSSGCENQGSRELQGEAVDAGEDENDGSGLWLARAAVAQGSVVVCARLMQTVVVGTAAARVTQGCCSKDSEKTGEGRR